MLRRAGQIREGHSDAVFKARYNDEIAIGCGRLEAQCHLPEYQHPLLTILKEVFELKRLNNKLFKELLIDDLIEDTYASLYAQVVPGLSPLPSESQPQKPSMPEIAPKADQSNTMSLNHMMNVDGTERGPSLPQALAMAQGHIPPAPHMHHDVPSRPRKQGIGRREIQKRAEAAINKPFTAAFQPTRQPSMPAATPTGQKVSVIIPSHTPDRRNTMDVDGASRPDFKDSEDGHEHDTGEDDTRKPRFPVMPPEGADVSFPGSVHDSADDESELSELDEEDIEDHGDHGENEDEEEEDEDEDEGGDVRQLQEEMERDRERSTSPQMKDEDEGTEMDVD
jgi:hypothetical protein